MPDSPSTTDPPKRRDFAVFAPVSVRWSDVDVYGHVNNVAYYSFVDTAVNGWLRASLGTDPRYLDAIGIVAETGCRFLAEIDFPAVIEVGLAVERIGTSSIVYRFGIFTDADPDADAAPRAIGKFVHVYVDREQRRPTPIPDAIRSSVSTLPGGS
jgi:acyl-CoA thioester hydrolase